MLTPSPFPSQGKKIEMAESAVSLVLGKLLSLLVGEAKLLGGVHREVEDIKDELESIQSFLKDADARAEKEDTNEGVKTWVKQVREVSYRIEDVIDEYMLHVMWHQRQNGIRRLVKKTAFMVKKIKLRRGVAAEARLIKASLAEIKERSNRYGFSSTEQESGGSTSNRIAWPDPRVASLFTTEAEAVGMESAKQELIGWLVDDPIKCKVISVIGMGGLGKTTLASVVYDNMIVKGHFECRAWITVSQSYNKEELLRSVMKQFCEAKESIPDAIDTMNEVMLITKLREYLQGKRYVVVFDDVWNINFCADIEHALLGANIGSRARVLITTRNKDVASYCKKSSAVDVNELQHLPVNKAWELFCKRAFRFDFEGHCPPNLKQLSLQIVERCRGLPLAIVTIAGLLSTKEKVASEWQKLNDSLGYEIKCNPHLTDISKILSLSYHDLPYYLKFCFLYFGIFPEDCAIPCVRLIRQWVAEGFVEGKYGKTLEETADEYLLELVHRNMVQWSWEGFNGVNKWCRIHDLMRDVILSKAAELGFCQVMEAKESVFNRRVRRLSIHNNAEDVVDTTCNSSIRSFFVCNVKGMPELLLGTYLGTLFERFKLLRVLDLDNAPLDHLPDNVGNLSLLRYLSVRNTYVSVLPKSIGNLYNLQTLNIQETAILELSFEIGRLHELRHFIGGSYNMDISFSLDSVKGVRLCNSVGVLDDIQTLIGIDAGNEVGFIKELTRLRQLRVLDITNLTTEVGRILCSGIENMNHLVSLDLSLMNEGETLDLESISAPPPFLQILILRGRLKKLPTWIGRLENVLFVRLDFSRLMDDPLQILRLVPNLTHVYLFESYTGEKLHIKKGGFRKLKELQLRSLNGLNTLRIEKDALPVLEILLIGPCPHLKEMPSDICHMTNLKSLEFLDMPKQFALRMLPGQGQDYGRIEHIPKVLFFYTTVGNCCETFKLGDPALLQRLQQ